MEKQGSFCRVMLSFLRISVFTGMKASLITKQKSVGTYSSIMHHLEVTSSQNSVLCYIICIIDF